VKESIENPIDIVQQCTMCKSEGELMIDEQRIKTIFDQERENYRYRNKLTIDHVKTLEKQIENLIKDKAMLQDQLDKYIDKEMDKR
jgi:CRISPR/Cas system CMR subunit Cmr4 (Cas7 group RAMP superfamily)